MRLKEISLNTKENEFLKIFLTEMKSIFFIFVLIFVSFSILLVSAGNIQRPDDRDQNRDSNRERDRDRDRDNNRERDRDRDNNNNRGDPVGRDRDRWTWCRCLRRRWDL